MSAGDGLKSDNPDDYIVRNHREGPKMFLREKAGKTNFLAVVVYTREAYIADPDMTEEELKVLDPWATYFVVAVIASSGPSAPVTPGRFVANLCGGNNEYEAELFINTLMKSLMVLWATLIGWRTRPRKSKNTGTSIQW